MNHDSIQPGSKDDHRFAAALVIEGVLPESTVRAILAKQKELLDRGKPLSVAQIVLRKGWATGSEVRLLSALEAPPADLLPGFQMGAQLGYGGMSRVYAAHRMPGGQPRALKILHPRLQRVEASRGAFLAEGKLLESLDHENLVTGHGVFEHDALVVMEMEWVEGRSLLELLDEFGRFQEDAALYIILQTARALTHLHGRGLVHRDIKPANILVDGQNRVKVCDLGLAVGPGALDEDGVTAGTAEYLSPEQAVGEAGLDVRSDIYALGVTLYHLIVGKLPFEGDTSEEVMVKRLLDELRSPELKALGVSPHLHYFIQKMMALDPSIRYQDPQGLIEDIEEQIEGRESLTHQPGTSAKGTGAPGASPAPPGLPTPKAPMLPKPRSAVRRPPGRRRR